MHFIYGLFLVALSLNAVAGIELTSEQINTRIKLRKEILSRSHSKNKEGSNLGTPAYFLASDVEYITKDIRSLERFSNVKLSNMMWSGFFWPNYLGGLGFRFQDSNFPINDWGKSRDYVRLSSSDKISNDLLSPSEKYDIVMGISPEEEGSLTSQQWRLGESEYSQMGTVATWQGICHGWAPASINFAIPNRQVVFSTKRGNITFYPDDIKALGSLLYANGRYESSYVGVRCNSTSPETDYSGRVLNSECFDINPADWHIIATHHLGMGKRPFIIDTVNSAEVWNKPLIGYEYKYLNIEHEVSSNNINTALVGIETARGLRLGAYRNPKTKYVLGIAMTILYLDGGFVRGNMNNAKELSFEYDLELDSDYQIIGGEWRSTIHPDFAWKPRFVALPATEGDAQASMLKPWEAAVSKEWRVPALKSITRGAPLTKFVKYLFDYSAY